MEENDAYKGFGAEKNSSIPQKKREAWLKKDHSMESIVMN